MVETVLTFTFWLSLAMILYTYAGYPVLLYLAGFIFEKPVKKQPAEPFVSVIISAFNEEKAIAYGSQTVNTLLNKYSIRYIKLIMPRSHNGIAGG